MWRVRIGYGGENIIIPSQFKIEYVRWGLGTIDRGTSKFDKIINLIVFCGWSLSSCHIDVLDRHGCASTYPRTFSPYR
jgi:hypothetical protein